MVSLFHLRQVRHLIPGLVRNLICSVSQIKSLSYSMAGPEFYFFILAFRNPALCHIVVTKYLATMFLLVCPAFILKKMTLLLCKDMISMVLCNM